MARQIIDIGTIGNDGTGTSIRESFRKVNSNFSELYSAIGSSSAGISFTQLTDVPSPIANPYTIHLNEIVGIKSDGSGLEYKKLVSGTGISITHSGSEVILDSYLPAFLNEPAIKSYINNRLGLKEDNTHADNLLPPTGGYLALSGLLAMKGILNMDNYRIRLLGTPVDLTDAARLQDITVQNLKNSSSNFFNLTSPIQTQLLAFYNGTSVENASVIGDIQLSRPAANNIQATIQNSAVTESKINNGAVTENKLATNSVTEVKIAANAVTESKINNGAVTENKLATNSVTNDKVSTSAGIVQSKLSLTSASTRANATGITQADLGVASFNSTYFSSTNGWISLVPGSLGGLLPTINDKTVLGNNSGASAVPASVNFSTVVDAGGGIKKSQYSSAGFLRRGPGDQSLDASYSIVEMSTTGTNNTLVQRNGSGEITGKSFKFTTATNDITVLSNSLDGSKGLVDLYGYSNGTLSSFKSFSSQNSTVENEKINWYSNSSHKITNQNRSTDYLVVDSTGTTVSGILTTTSVTSGGASTQGSVEGNWNYSSAPSGKASGNSVVTINAGASLGEFYSSDNSYSVGTVVAIGGTSEITQSTSANQDTVVGVVTDSAGVALYGDCPGTKVLVATQGRVQVKVIGTIVKGNLLSSSATPGVATAALPAPGTGTVIGRALEDYDDVAVGTILMSVCRM